MGAVREYLLTITVASLIVSLAEAVTPQGSVKRVIKFLGGLIVLLSALSPLGELISNWRLPEADWELSLADEVMVFQEQSNNMTGMLIIEKCEEYILDKARQLGAEIIPEISLAYPDGTPVPWRVTVSGTYTHSQKIRLSEFLARELAIPEERQVWRSCEDLAESSYSEANVKEIGTF